MENNNQKKDEIISLFTEEAKMSISNKHLTSETFTCQGKEINIIYIADDEWIKDYYKKELFKEPTFTKNESDIKNSSIKQLEILIESQEQQEKQGNLTEIGISYLNGLRQAMNIIKK